MVAADTAFVHQPGQPAGPGKYTQQGHLRQRNRAGAVVDQNEVLAGQGQFIPAAGSRAVDGANVGLPRVVGGVLDRVPGLVGELAEVHLQGVAGLGQHPDVGPGGEQAVPARGDNHGADLRMFEPQSLGGVI